MKKLVVLGLIGAALVGCSGGSDADKSLDTASTTANVPAPTTEQPKTAAPGAPGALSGPSAKPGS